MNLDMLRNQILSEAPQRAVPRQFYYKRQGPVHVVVLHDSAKMKIIKRPGNQTINDTVDLDSDGQGGVVVTGSFAPPLYLWRAGFDPIPLRHWKFDGRVAINGRRYVIEWDENGIRERYSGNSQYAAVGAFLAFADGGGNRRYRFGIGDVPPMTQDGYSVTGLSALIPMILTTNTGPTIYPGNWWYKALAAQGVIGRVVVGHNPAAHQIAVIVQEHNAAECPLDQLRDFALGIGCAYAVGLDGSDSAILRFAHGNQGPWLVKNNNGYKNRYNGNAVAFYYP